MVHKWAEAASFFLPLSRHQPHECCTGGKFGQELRLCVLMIVSSFCAHRRRLKPQVALKLFQGTPSVEAERGSGHTHPPSAAVNLNSGRSLSMSDQLVFNKLWCAKSSYFCKCVFEIFLQAQSRWDESYRDPLSPVDQASCASARASSFFIALCSMSHDLVLCEPQDHHQTHMGVFLDAAAGGWASLC